MRAVGEYALIRIENITNSSGIQVKNDGEGVCISCPNFRDIEGKLIVFDTNQKYPERDGYIIVHSSFIMAVIN
jgi:hypothetical protein